MRLGYLYFIVLCLRISSGVLGNCRTRVGLDFAWLVATLFWSAIYGRYNFSTELSLEWYLMAFEVKFKDEILMGKLYYAYSKMYSLRLLGLIANGHNNNYYYYPFCHSPYGFMSR